MTEQTREWIHRAQQGDNEACERLIAENSGLIWSIVRRYYGRSTEPDDLYRRRAGIAAAGNGRGPFAGEYARHG